ncbi:MAG: hypothetical protein MR645_02585, partial [Paraprevotella sp.]|nr:hypothetical protein [Paraprevotella sp.]
IVLRLSCSATVNLPIISNASLIVGISNYLLRWYCFLLLLYAISRQKSTICCDRAKEIKECWKNDPQKGIQELQALDKKFKDIRAYNAVLDLRDSYLDALLFLPDKLSENLEQYITTMINFVLEIKDGHELGKKSNKSGWAGTAEELEEKTKKLTKDMQQELQK